MTPKYLSCLSCKMTFKSPSLLEKHREKFCIGTEFGRALITKTPEDMLNQLKDYKRRREEQRKQQEMEERDILEEMDENERRLIYDHLTFDEQEDFAQDGPSPRQQWFQEYKNQLQNLAQDHRNHVTALISHNKELEEQRTEIVKKLKDMSEKGKISSQVENMLAELKAQEYKNELLLESMKQQLEILQLETEDARPQTPTLAKHFLDSNEGLGPAPYDPVAGFVVFYDFLLGLDPTYRVCRLVVGLYHGGQEMGDSSPLPAVYCDIDNSAAYFPDAGGGNRAIVAMKQVVRRVRPSPGISLIMELQASGGCDPYGQDINRLISRGWIKIDIFDSQNRVISGRWKVPVRVLPVKPSMTTSELNGVPQLENVELYLRLVNARDANVQTTAAIDSNNATLYKYPPLASARTTIPIDAPFSSYNSSYRYPTMQLVYPSFGETVDPPPPSADMMVLQCSPSARTQ
ncbi:uncharacterized protein LOC109929514 [Rhincodon typus]|uniref:uncharacterized protein LOC109929514 n=1 Tax=Rhincodon typus TaxID=259920 RepID=UPI0020306153|nr:uncharacterized protein LOC109929514 [Rhincodon typus]